MNVGIDIGTSVTKAVVFDDDGEVVVARSTPTPLVRPSTGRYEYDAADIVDTTLELLKATCESFAPDVTTIAVTGQGDGLWLLAEEAHGVRPAIAWLDPRGAAVCDEWSSGGVVEKVFSRTANAPFPGAGAALLAALDRTDPDVLDAARTATQCQHVIFERLTGVRTATPSCAMLPVFDPATADYDEAAIKWCGLEHRRDLLPPVAKAVACVEEMRDDIAIQLGLASGTTVASGPYDLPAAALGVGTLALGDGILILGTTLACQVRVDHVDTDTDPAGLTLCAGDGDGWLRAMPAMVGTACIDWVLNLIKAKHQDLGELLARSAPGATGVSALPYLSPAGERAPFADSAARAELTGLSVETTDADVVRAVCESLAYAARHCFDSAGLSGDVVVCGGGTASAELMQVFADVMGSPLAVVSDDEPAARGAVMAARQTFRATTAHAFSARVALPNDGAAGRYADGYNDYLERLRVARRYRWQKESRAAP